MMHKYSVNGLKGKLLDDASPYIRQKPNRKFLGIGFIKPYVAIYNFFDRGKSTKFKEKMKRNIGEKPIIYDSTLTVISARQIQQYLFNKGYFNAIVTSKDTIIRKKAYVTYNVDKQTPYTIRNIHYSIEDSIIRSIYFLGLRNSKFKLDDIYDQDKIQEERERITQQLKNHGYYFFNREYIHFDADTALQSYQVDLYLIIENLSGGKHHQSYKVDDIEVNIRPTEEIPRQRTIIDTGYIDGVRIVDPERKFKKNVIKRMIYVEKDELYKDREVDLTYSRFGDLGVFKFINIDFARDTTDSSLLDCMIELSPRKKQTMAPEAEAYIASENIGASINLNFANRNLFRGAELFEFKIRGGFETQAFVSEKNRGLTRFNSRESQTTAAVTFPKFLFLSESRSNGRFANPRTRVSVTYTYETRPEYTRRVLNSAFTYEWRQNQFVSHSFSPFDISFVNSRLSTEAKESFDNLNNNYLRASFDPHVSLGLKYTLTINRQVLNLLRNYYYLRFSIEETGATLYGASTLLERPKDENGQYRFLDLPFYNYIRPEIDARYFRYIDRKKMIVYRINSGAGLTYWNSTVLPFEKQFFVGGSNSIRAFKARSIGPGSFNPKVNDSTQTTLNIDRTGDLKIEGNIEYRYDIFERFIGGKLKGAVFFDFGNVWVIANQTQTSESKFTFENFHKEFAVGTGLGFRMDYSFLLFRFDFGLKLRDPQFPEHERWVINHYFDNEWKRANAPPLSSKYNFISFNFGIGYPF
jgi:outer membrane protein insertion porin family